MTLETPGRGKPGQMCKDKIYNGQIHSDDTIFLHCELLSNSKDKKQGFQNKYPKELVS